MTPDDPVPPVTERRPLYARLLRLHHLELATWQRVLYIEGALAVGLVLALGELASPWTILALPLLIAAVVKFHDVLAGLLAGAQSHRGEAGSGTEASSTG